MLSSSRDSGPQLGLKPKYCRPSSRDSGPQLGPKPKFLDLLLGV